MTGDLIMLLVTATGFGAMKYLDDTAESASNDTCWCFVLPGAGFVA